VGTRDLDAGAVLRSAVLRLQEKRRTNPENEWPQRFTGEELP
jgi:hypothetical protein